MSHNVGSSGRGSECDKYLCERAKPVVLHWNDISSGVNTLEVAILELDSIM